MILEGSPASKTECMSSCCQGPLEGNKGSNTVASGLGPGVSPPGSPKTVDSLLNQRRVQVGVGGGRIGLGLAKMREDNLEEVGVEGLDVGTGGDIRQGHHRFHISQNLLTALKHCFRGVVVGEGSVEPTKTGHGKRGPGGDRGVTGQGLGRENKDSQQDIVITDTAGLDLDDVDVVRDKVVG